MSENDELAETAETQAETVDSTRDTLPMGKEVPKSRLLELIADADWKRAATVRAANAPDEAYWCEVDGARLRFERKEREWQGHLVPVEGDEKLRTEASEDISRVARALDELFGEWREGRGE